MNDQKGQQQVITVVTRITSNEATLYPKPSLNPKLNPRDPLLTSNWNIHDGGAFEPPLTLPIGLELAVNDTVEFEWKPIRDQKHITKARIVKQAKRIHGKGVINLPNLQMPKEGWPYGYIHTDATPTPIFCVPSNITEYADEVENGDIVEFVAAPTQAESNPNHTRKFMAIRVRVIQKSEAAKHILLKNDQDEETSLREWQTQWHCLIANEQHWTAEQAREQKLTDVELTWTSDSSPLTAMFTNRLDQTTKFLCKGGDELNIKQQTTRGYTLDAIASVTAINHLDDIVEEIHLQFSATISFEKLAQGHSLTTNARYTIMLNPDLMHTKNLHKMVRNISKQLQEGSDRRKQIFEILLGRKKDEEPMPQTVDEDVLPDSDNFLATERQRQIAQAILKEKRPVTNVNGPPGCGKSTVICKLCEQSVDDDAEARIHIACPSNYSADTLTLKLAEMAKKNEDLMPLRLYSVKRQGLALNRCNEMSLSYYAHKDEEHATDDIHEQRREIARIEEQIKSIPWRTFRTAKEKHEAKVEANKLNKMVKEARRALERTVFHMRYKHIVITTLSNAKDYRIEIKPKFLIVDEAGFASVPDVIHAAGALHKEDAQQVALIGDDRQIGPISTSSGVSGMLMGISLPAWLNDLHILPKFRLIDAFRSHPDLIDFLSEEIYDSELQSAITADDRSLLIAKFPWPKKHCPLLFSAVSTEEQRSLNSTRSNDGEADGVLAVVQFAMEYCNLKPTQIIVLTTYDGQRLLVIQKLRQFNIPLPLNRVSTVDNYLGQECDFVILSTVRSRQDPQNSEPTQALGFLVDPRRFTVAVSRAKYGMVLIGNPDALAADSLWERYLYHLGEYNLIQENFHMLLPKYASVSNGTMKTIICAT